MKKIMRRFFKSFAYGEKGFTLVEMLVVVAILGILAAVAVPSLTGLTSRAKTNAAAAELSTVQTAVDAMMADKSLTTLASPATNSQAMNAFPNATYFLYPDYIRTASTHGFYGASTNGQVTLGTGGYP